MVSRNKYRDVQVYKYGVYFYIYYRQRDRPLDNQLVKKSDRMIDTSTDRQIKCLIRQKDRQIYRLKEIKIERQIDISTDRNKDRKIDRYID